MNSLLVQTPSHQYPIYIGKDIMNNFALIKEVLIGTKVAIVTNTTIAKLYLSRIQQMLTQHNIDHFVIILADGEQYKNLDSLNQIYNGLLTNHADRHTTLIALGGGVIGDTAGFAAATYQRGIPFIQIPTTLLSQVDSSVGGKTAVNHPLGKNMIGAFYQPQAVITDLATLDSLPQREFSAGMAEVIKYALLGDANFLVWLEENITALMKRDEAALAYAIYHCCKMKADIVAADETEQGIRAWLNLGHTFGHAIEAEMGYGVWLHGEAVAAGMVLAAQLSEQLGCINADDTARIKHLLTQAQLPISPPHFSFEKWLAHMQHDKKVQNGKMRFVTLTKLGQAEIRTIEQTDQHLLMQILKSY